jgi:hypothetical protein
MRTQSPLTQAHPALSSCLFAMHTNCAHAPCAQLVRDASPLDKVLQQLRLTLLQDEVDACPAEVWATCRYTPCRSSPG